MQATNRQGTFEVDGQRGWTILDALMKANVEWGFSCTRGTCARCRCLITAGMDGLQEVSDAEWDRLTEEELAQGYRLACQAVIIRSDAVEVTHKPYF